LLFAALFQILKVLNFDSPLAVVMKGLKFNSHLDHQLYGPRIVQGILSGIGDLFLYKLTKKHFGESIAKWTISLNFDFIT
jgi:hypothetical protein